MRHALIVAIYLLAGFLPTGEKCIAQTPNFTRAVVVGVSNYQDPEVPDLKFARRDAEAFAAFLQSASGGKLEPDRIRLLTDEQATAARFAAALDWLWENRRAGERSIVYFAGYGEVPLNKNETPGYFLLYDSPLAPMSAGGFDFLRTFDRLFDKKGNAYTLIVNVFPLILPPDRTYVPPSLLLAAKKSQFAKSASLNLVTPETFKMDEASIARTKISLNNLLLDGLLGLGDKDADRVVTFHELSKFLDSSSIPDVLLPSLLMIATSGKHDPLSTVDEKVLKALTQHSDQLFPSIVHLETKAHEDRILAQVPDEVRHIYQDFVIGVKLGNLMEPAGRNASILYDSLKAEQSIQTLHGDLRRKLAAALLDETQQALNAYLNTDVREILRRRKDSRYKLYPKYLARAIELLGEKHFMNSILQAKRYYFEGLALRLEGNVKKDTDAYLAALDLQQKALAYEDEAPFVINEMGVIYTYLGNHDKALEHYKRAIELAPNWSLPYSNVCFVLGKQGKIEEALLYGIQSVKLSPRNALAFDNLGLAFYKSGDPVDAEKAFQKAIQLDPEMPEAHFNLACLKAKTGDFDLAIKHLDNALQLGFDNYDDLMAQVEFQRLKDDGTLSKLLEKYATTRK
jgi:tetratricopeptide (TPR) repeat protein